MAVFVGTATIEVRAYWSRLAWSHGAGTFHASSIPPGEDYSRGDILRRRRHGVCCACCWLQSCVTRLWFLSVFIRSLSLVTTESHIFRELLFWSIW